MNELRVVGVDVAGLEPLPGRLEGVVVVLVHWREGRREGGREGVSV